MYILYILTYTHTYIHTCINIHTYIHTYMTYIHAYIHTVHRKINKNKFQPKDVEVGRIPAISKKCTENIQIMKKKIINTIFSPTSQAPGTYTAGIESDKRAIVLQCIHIQTYIHTYIQTLTTCTNVNKLQYIHAYIHLMHTVHTVHQ